MSRDTRRLAIGCARDVLDEGRKTVCGKVDRRRPDPRRQCHESARKGGLPKSRLPYGSSPILSFTAPRRRCLQRRYLSVVSTETCPSTNWICSSSPPAVWHSLAHVRRQAWGDSLAVPALAAAFF